MHVIGVAHIYPHPTFEKLSTFLAKTLKAGDLVGVELTSSLEDIAMRHGDDPRPEYEFWTRVGRVFTQKGVREIPVDSQRLHIAFADLSFKQRQKHDRSWLLRRSQIMLERAVKTSCDYLIVGSYHARDIQHFEPRVPITYIYRNSPQSVARQLRFLKRFDGWLKDPYAKFQ
jgi:hypothetical protein